jgi:hypothetical protein
MVISDHCGGLRHPIGFMNECLAEVGTSFLRLILALALSRT